MSWNGGLVFYAYGAPFAPPRDCWPGPHPGDCEPPIVALYMAAPVDWQPAPSSEPATAFRIRTTADTDETSPSDGDCADGCDSVRAAVLAERLRIVALLLHHGYSEAATKILAETEV